MKKEKSVTWPSLNFGNGPGLFWGIWSPLLIPDSELVVILKSFYIKLNETKNTSAKRLL